jgi:dockerin type I repeat protein
MKQQSPRSSKTFCSLRSSVPVRAVGIIRSAVLIIAFASGVCAQCVLKPSTAIVPAGSTVTISVTGAPGGEAYFLISDGPNRAEGSGLTSLSAWTYSTTHGIGTDTVTASGTYQGQSFSCAPAFVTWTPPSCSLAPAAGTASLASSHTVVASVVNGDGAPIGNTKISFFVSNGPNVGKNSGLFPPTTDSAGKVSFTYNPYLPPASGTDTIVASGSIAFNSVSFACSATVTWVLFRCDEGSEVAVTLPTVMHSPAFLTKPWRVSYGNLPLTFAVTKPYGTLCEAQSNLGALPLLIGVPNGPQLSVAKSETTATLTVFEPGVVLSKPGCSFWPVLPGQWTDDCILDGREFDPQATYLKWYSPGFKITPLPYVSGVLLPAPRNIPAMQFWVNLTQRGLDHADMKTVLERIEPEIHQELIGKLPAFAWWTVIQDPGYVRLLVIDSSGQTTGTLPDGRRTNDILNSFIYDDATNPGAFFLGTLEGSYMVILTGLRSGDFALAASNLAGDNAASQQVLSGWVTKRDRFAYRVSTTAVSGTPMQFITRANLLDGDLNGDERVDCADVAVVKTALGKRLGEVGYNAWADINADGIVDARDVTSITKRLTRRVTCP